MASALKRTWAWLFGRKSKPAYYPEEEPKTWEQRADETLGWSDRATWGEGSESREERQDQPFR
jgi:hypothetical protein